MQEPTVTPEEDEIEEEMGEMFVARKFTPSKFETVRVVPADERMTSDMMSKAEFTRAICTRIMQIDSTGKHFVKDAAGLTNSEQIACREMLERKNPLILVRTIARDETSRTVEKWAVRDMIFPMDLEITPIDERMTDKYPPINAITEYIKKHLPEKSSSVTGGDLYYDESEETGDGMGLDVEEYVEDIERARETQRQIQTYSSDDSDDGYMSDEYD